ncbi:MAG: hypothetical protein GX621_00620 [Pirellulaceae bacterium]|nr:hypothetical protein [Pirellulaceae bacterium]
MGVFLFYSRHGRLVHLLWRTRLRRPTAEPSGIAMAQDFSRRQKAESLDALAAAPDAGHGRSIWYDRAKLADLRRVADCTVPAGFLAARPVDGRFDQFGCPVVKEKRRVGRAGPTASSAGLFATFGVASEFNPPRKER